MVTSAVSVLNLGVQLYEMDLGQMCHPEMPAVALM